MLLSCWCGLNISSFTSTSHLLCDFLFFFPHFFYLAILFFSLFFCDNFRCCIVNVANSIDFHTYSSWIKFLHQTMNKLLFTLSYAFERICFIGIKVGLSSTWDKNWGITIVVNNAQYILIWNKLNFVNTWLFIRSRKSMFHVWGLLFLMNRIFPNLNFVTKR